MNPSISIAAACVYACLSAVAPACADQFDQTAAQTLTTAGPSIKAALRTVGTQKPTAPTTAPVKLKFDPGVPKIIRQHMSSDLSFVAAIQGSGATSLHGQVFGKVDGPTYIGWFTDRAKSIGYDADDTEDIAYVDISTESGTDHAKVWLAKGYTEKGRPQIARVDDIFHEARHTEDAHGNWEHVDCPDPYKDDKGQDVTGIGGGKVAGMEGGCDDTPVGAYGVAAIMLRNIQKFCVSAGCTKKVLMDAGLYSDDDVKRVIGAQAAQAIKADLSQ